MVIGLTGGISSGKSTVAQFLEELGAVIIDADKVGHEAFLPGTELWREVVSTFGEDILSASPLCFRLFGLSQDQVMPPVIPPRFHPDRIPGGF